MDDNEKKIAKGRHHLTMKVIQKYGEDNPDAELFKIPLEALYSMALQHIGEQETYIEELECKITELQKELAKKEQKTILSREENKRIAQEVRREEVIANIYKRSVKTEAENKRLRQLYKEVVNQLCQKISEIENLRDRLHQNES